MLTSIVTMGKLLLQRQRYAEAEPLIRESLDSRRNALPEGHWLIYHTMSLLGASLSGQGKFSEAQPLLLDARQGLVNVADAIPPALREIRLRRALDHIVKLYESWHAAEPDKGYDIKAADWRAKLSVEHPSSPEDAP